MVRRHNLILDVATCLICGVTAVGYGGLLGFYTLRPQSPAYLLAGLGLAGAGLTAILVGINVARKAIARRRRIRRAGHSPAAWGGLRKS